MSETPPDPSSGGESPGRDVDRDGLNTDVMQWVSALAALVGLWIVASPFLFEATDTASWNNALVGTGIFVLAGYNFYLMSRDRLANVPVAALAVLLGIWILVSPAVIEMGSDALATSSFAAGAIVAVLSAYNAYATNRAETVRGARARA